MPCPSSGKITLQDLVDEFGGSAPHSLGEYYRNGSLVPGNNTSVPESGQISLTQFYSAVNEIIHTHSSNATNQNYATVFGSNWTSSVPKRIVINSGVTIGASVGNHAMNIPSGMGGTLVIDNNGNVHGHGGASNGGVGGDAIHCTSTAVTINNNSEATIKSGGGGGGQGGTGGTGGNGGAGGTGGNGRWTQYRGFTCPSNCPGAGHWSGGSRWAACVCAFGMSDGYYSNGTACAYTYGSDIIGTWCYQYHYTTGGAGGAGGSSGGAGGAGGAGGVGQGYNQSAGSGSSGSAGASGGAGASGAAGGTGSGAGGAGGARGQGGTGGNGGAGGAFGAAGSSGTSGSTGSAGASGSTGANGNQSNGSGGSGGSSGGSASGGSSGGAAGYYIYNRASITLNNSGTVAGN